MRVSRYTVQLRGPWGIASRSAQELVRGGFTKSSFVRAKRSYRLQNSPKVGTPLAFYRVQKGPSLENSEKCLKRGSRGQEAPGPKKTRKRIENDHFLVFFGFLTRFRIFFDFFRAFLTTGPRGPGNPFSDFFRRFQAGAFLTPVEGQRCPNPKVKVVKK